MRYLFFLGHPAHFHLFRFVVPALQKNGHQTVVLIRSKDILEDLCKRQDLAYVNVLPEQRGSSKLSLAISYWRKYIRISRIIKQFKPNLLLGSEPSLVHLGKFFKIPSIIFSEDDVTIIPQFAKITYPFVNTILSPASCNAGKWDYKKIGYNGYHKLTYLHPAVFKPNRDEIIELGTEDYFVLRFAQLNAYHDKNKTGITREIAFKLIEILKPYGKVYITSERTLEPELEKYRLAIDPLKIHHALYFAKLYIGDSQSMAVESALLGTPGIRFNDFAGEIGVLNELEGTYGLTYGIKTDSPEKLYDKVAELVRDPNLKENFKEKRAKLLNDKINVFAFFTWFIQNYPDSEKQLRSNMDRQYDFK
jgi:predicted glycosyltransferase